MENDSETTFVSLRERIDNNKREMYSEIVERGYTDRIDKVIRDLFDLDWELNGTIYDSNLDKATRERLISRSCDVDAFLLYEMKTEECKKKYGYYKDGIFHFDTIVHPDKYLVLDENKDVVEMVHYPTKFNCTNPKLLEAFRKAHNLEINNPYY